MTEVESSLSAGSQDKGIIECSSWVIGLTYNAVLQLGRRTEVESWTLQCIQLCRSRSRS